ncbi:MAG TPA: glycosyltransferase family 4 protein [Thermoleophilaceae bacterium]|nr:glycosyltransferase family 4 protein [Thermoleophilaceae bacterium]
MRVQLVDPSGDVTPYDHALAGALARRGADVELVTSRFVHGPVPRPAGYELSEVFYRRANRHGARKRGLRRALKLLEHGPDMLRYRKRAAAADVRHFQWLPLEPLDLVLLPDARPRVLTMHNVLRRDGSERRTRWLAESMDAVVVHTRAGAERLAELGVPAERVRVIPHGAFDHLTRQEHEAPLPPELAEVEGPVVLYFGTVRPYKGVEVLLEAFTGIEGAELWVVGHPLGVSMERLYALARVARGRVRFVSRYVTDAETPAFLRRADLLVLPHLRVDQSGVLFAGLAFGKPMVLSDVGGFAEVAADHGAGRAVPPGDPAALAAAIEALLADPGERRALGERAAAAAAGPFSWDGIAERTLALYEELRG